MSRARVAHKGGAQRTTEPPLQRPPSRGAGGGNAFPLIKPITAPLSSALGLAAAPAQAAASRYEDEAAQAAARVAKRGLQRTEHGELMRTDREIALANLGDAADDEEVQAAVAAKAEEERQLEANQPKSPDGFSSL